MKGKPPGKHEAYQTAALQTLSAAGLQSIAV